MESDGSGKGAGPDRSADRDAGEETQERLPDEEERDAAPAGPSVVLASLDDLVNWLVKVVDWGLGVVPVRGLVNRIARPVFTWSQRASVFALHSGLACCAMEMGVAGMPRLDSERLGVAWFSSPRRCDLFLVNGWITKKTRPVLLTLYEQMPEPKWVIAMGECAISGGPWHDSYNVVYGADELLPVDIYIPGCPPRPEALLDALWKIQKKLAREGSASGLKVG
ncbi:MAG: NADH-quinone oxidoreductase subunit B [Euryarchaeota archaeon]|nr:NADH-quinone oxidoreductase subunit B [Euryarchaeota archaeon]